MFKEIVVLALINAVIFTIILIVFIGWRVTIQSKKRDMIKHQIWQLEEDKVELEHQHSFKTFNKLAAGKTRKKMIQVQKEIDIKKIEMKKIGLLW